MADSRLDQIEHFVVMVFENRSFDHILGFLYEKERNISPLGHPFDGLTGAGTVIVSGAMIPNRTM